MRRSSIPGQLELARKVAALDFKAAFRCRESEVDIWKARAIDIVGTLEGLDRHWAEFAAFMKARDGEGAL